MERSSMGPDSEKGFVARAMRVVEIVFIVDGSGKLGSMGVGGGFKARRDIALD